VKSPVNGRSISNTVVVNNILRSNVTSVDFVVTSVGRMEFIEGQISKGVDSQSVFGFLVGVVVVDEVDEVCGCRVVILW